MARQKAAGMRALILTAFFVSGGCALVYEVIWTRLLGLVMGNTVYAVSTTLAAFMGGLALGSYLFGRIADRMGRPGRFYGLLEIVIGLYCLALPALIAAADPVYTYAYRELSASFAVMTAIRFVTAGLVLLVPAALMGATLPVLSRFYVSHGDRLGWEVGRLYALNTCGAVLGTLLAGFVLLPALGIKASLAGTAAVNLALGCAVLLSSRSEVERAQEAGRTPEVGGTPEAEGPQEAARSQGAARAPGPAPREGPRQPGSFGPGGRYVTVALAFALSGFAALTYEVAWTRIISLLIGPSTYAFSLMLACFLTGLALGGWIAARWIDRRRESAGKVMAFLLLGAAAAALGLLPALTAAVPLIRDITRAHSQSFIIMYGVYFGLIALLLLLPTTLLGAVFPTAVRAAAPAVREVGKRVGGLYAANTLGAIAGAVVAGFLLVPTLGLSRAVAAGAAFQLAGAALLFLAGGGKSLAALCAAVAVVGFVASPRPDPKTLSSGPYKYLYTDNAAAEQILERRQLLYYKEGVNATVSVARDGSQLALAIDGKVDASLGADMDTQILLAHLPMLLCIAPRSVLVIGLASGVTLGSAETHPGVETIECVEISPEVIEASGFFAEYNYDPLSDPRLSLEVHDARNFLKMTNHTYDVIISEPSNPWMSGASALFTREFFDSCLERLNDGGMLCQWLQGYAIPTPMLRSVIATFCEVFPHVSLWMPLKGDLILLGSGAPLSLDAQAVARRMSSGRVRSDLDRIGLSSWEQLAGLNVGLGPALCRACAGAPIQTDNRPLLEFALPRVLHRRVELAAQNLSWLAGDLGDPGSLVRNVRGGADLERSEGAADPVMRARRSAASYKEYILGQVSEWTGDPEGAAGHYTRALGGAAGRRSALKPLYLFYCRKGLEAERRGFPEDADGFYRQAIALDPRRAEGHYLLGLRLLETGRAEEAAGELGEAVAADPRRIEPVLAYGDVVSQLGRHDQALLTMKQMLSMAPDDPRAWYGAARIQARAGNVSEARQALSRAFALEGAGLRERAMADSVLTEAGVGVGDIAPNVRAKGR